MHQLGKSVPRAFLSIIFWGNKNGVIFWNLPVPSGAHWNPTKRQFLGECILGFSRWKQKNNIRPNTTIPKKTSIPCNCGGQFFLISNDLWVNYITSHRQFLSKFGRDWGKFLSSVEWHSFKNFGSWCDEFHLSPQKKLPTPPRHVCLLLFFELMANCWFGLMVWIPGIPIWKGLLLRCIPKIPNHQPKPTINH